MTHRSNGPSKFTNETGAIMPIVALMIVILLVFAAFTVDLGAAWAQRREAQTAADAGAMAGALAVGDVVAGAIDYVERNVGDPTSLDWASCSDPDPEISSFTTPDGDLITFSLADPSRTTCVWIGSVETDTNATYVAVRTPNLAVDTSFARVIGIDTIDVDAFAISRLVKEGDARILPFTVEVNPADHSCLGSPPGGVALNPCTGSSSGNYGYIDSPNHGDDVLGTTNSCDGQPNALAVLEINVAIGSDHPIEIDPTYPADPATADADYRDGCDGKEPVLYKPNSIVVQTGNEEVQMHNGLVSNKTFYGHPSLLQNPPVLPSGHAPAISPTRTILGKQGGDLVVDNVGLWEYIDSKSTGACSWLNNPSWLVGGPPATTALLNCLDKADDGGNLLVFDGALLKSPRLAVIPEMWGYFPSGGSADRAIKQFRVVYIQGLQFDNPSYLSFVGIDGSPYPIFYPGEGTEAACPGGKVGKCQDSQLRGMTALVLPLEASPSGVIDLGPNADSPFVAELVR